MSNRAGEANGTVRIGERAVRKEDFKLLQGQGRYTDDVSLPGQAYAVMVRSRHAHGMIKSIDTAAAKASRGVLAVYTAADLNSATAKGRDMVIPARDGKPIVSPPRPILAIDRVVYVGQVVACVVAESVAQAKDAAELVEIDIDPLPVVLDPNESVAEGTTQLHPGNLRNTVIDFQFGDAKAVDAAFAGAAHVVKQKMLNNRIVVAAMEPRAGVAQYDKAREHWTLYTPSQGVFGMRENLRATLGTTVDKLHVITGNVGGSFGMKGQVYSETVCILHAARALDRPVKWTDDRSESFMSDTHGRSAELTGELALDRDGKFLALRMTGFGDMGAFLAGPQTSTTNTVKNIVGVYTTPAVEVATKMIVTNKTPVGAYRGAGRPEANYYMARLIEMAARDMKIDPVDIRRRNMIPASAIPYKTPTQNTYDSGNFPAVFEQALTVADWNGFEARKRESAARGKVRGRGLAPYLEATGPISKEMGGLRFDEDGGITMITGTLDYGQGHATPFAQIVSEKLGVPFDNIRLIQGDSDKLIAGGGSGGSKSLMSSGAALIAASDDVVARGKKIAGHMLEAAAEDIEFSDGRFAIVGTDRSMSVMELADAVRAGRGGAEFPTGSLDAGLIVDTPPMTFPNGCHIAEVEIDPETGLVEVAKYSMVNDFGVVINPPVVEGQAHGGVVQGIGQALMENVIYDEQGQPLTGSFMDYGMPRAADIPAMTMEFMPSPATTNPMGAKGCGEAGCAGALPSVMNAIVDALSVYGIRHIDMPATPARVWQAIQQAQH